MVFAYFDQPLWTPGRALGFKEVACGVWKAEHRKYLIANTTFDAHIKNMSQTCVWGWKFLLRLLFSRFPYIHAICLKITQALSGTYSSPYPLLKAWSIRLFSSSSRTSPTPFWVSFIIQELTMMALQVLKLTESHKILPLLLDQLFLWK